MEFSLVKVSGLAESGCSVFTNGVNLFIETDRKVLYVNENEETIEQWNAAHSIDF
jgi:hypothetical protein